MGFLDEWPFKSQAKRNEENDAFMRRCLPLGMEQRDMLAKLLSPLIKAKMSREEKLFAYLVAKEIFLKGEGSEGAVAQVYDKLRQLRFKDAGDRRVIVALLRLDARLTDLASFPAPEAVLAAALLENDE